MTWRIKGIVQKALSTAPGGVRVNDLLQRTMGGLRNIDATVDSKVVDDWVVLARHLGDLNVQLAGVVLVEVGMGWFPVLPLCFVLAGARTCHTFDVTRHLDRRLTSRVIARLRVHLPRIADAVGVDVDHVRRRYERVAGSADVSAALERAGVCYHAPADAARTGLSNRSVDTVFPTACSRTFRAGRSPRSCVKPPES